MKKVFISGESGMLGRTIALFVSINNKFELVNGQLEANYTNEYHFHEGKQVKDSEVDILDLVQIEKLKDILDEDSIIIHCASYVNTDKCEKYSYEAVMSNIIGTQNLIDVALYVKCKFINFSTTAVFDPDAYMLSGGIFNEESQIHAKTIYGATKFAAELAVKQSGIDFVTIKPVFVFGNYPHDNSSNIVKIFKQFVQKEGRIPITLADNYLKNYMPVAQFVEMFNEILLNVDSVIGQDFIISRRPEQAKSWYDWKVLISQVSGKSLTQVEHCINQLDDIDYLKDHLGYSMNFYKLISKKDFDSRYDIIESLKQSYTSVLNHQS